ncbi:hypothetical protein X777_04998 [Ooceraea biroi]|uniref:Uncharacterized protein n=1 Tax=Ooceraea biroi TaxID=2015173 RepID=A0A026WFK8_OOCBI|nr:hypothetical protein X777_04998 [Ooceraea biroi]
MIPYARATYADEYSCTVYSPVSSVEAKNVRSRSLMIPYLKVYSTSVGQIPCWFLGRQNRINR